MTDSVHSKFFTNSGTVSKTSDELPLKLSNTTISSKDSVGLVMVPSISMTNEKIKATFALNQGCVPRIGTVIKQADFLDLNSNNIELSKLLVLKCLSEFIELFKGRSDKKVMIFDLGTSNSLSSSNVVEENDANIKVAHLSLPSTLVKRPQFDFLKLLCTKITKESMKQQLLESIETSDEFIFFDEVSKFNHCLKSTYWLVQKFVTYKGSDNLKNMYLLESDEKLSPKKKVYQPDSQVKRKPKFNLSISIPSQPTNSDKGSLFVQSIKKGSIQYSPNSLKKYFEFKVPSHLSHELLELPKWLRQYAKSDLISTQETLESLSRKFGLLEKLETGRLEGCLLKSQKPLPSPSLVVPSTTKSQEAIGNRQQNIYSLATLRKQFKKQRRVSTMNKNIRSLNCSELENLDTKENVKDSTTSKTLKLTIARSNGSSGSPTSPNGSDTLLTPLDFYEISQGIQSFTRNRYSNILPYEHSRVKLQVSPTIPPSKMPLPVYNDFENSGKSKEISYFNKPSRLEKKELKEQNRGSFNDYFNANYLKLSQINPDYNYIATQAPLPSTIDDFWKVVLTNKVKIIVSLISDEELQMRKWDIYWDTNLTKKHDITIEQTLENVFGIDGCILRVFKVSKASNGEKSRLEHASEHTVYQLQYTKWLDSCGVDMKEMIKLYQLKTALLTNSTELLKELKIGLVDFDGKKLVNLAEANVDSSSSPVLVHCSAGCGRTGVFITLDFIMNVVQPETSQNNEVDVWNMDEDLIFIVVNELRKQRLSMVQNLTQYITCYEALLQYFACKHKVAG